MSQFGQLFVFEGLDGAGKTTLANELKIYLQSNGVNCTALAFPGNERGTLGRHIYKLHHQPARFRVQSINPTSRQILHVAAHIDAIERRILPALQGGQTVILDRFWWSTWVYGAVYGANMNTLKSMIAAEQMHWNGVRPAALFLIQKGVPQSTDSHPDQAKRLWTEYNSLAKLEVKHYPVVIINNSGSIEEALERIVKSIHQRRMHEFLLLQRSGKQVRGRRTSALAISSSRSKTRLYQG